MAHIIAKRLVSFTLRILEVTKNIVNNYATYILATSITPRRQVISASFSFPISLPIHINKITFKMVKQNADMKTDAMLNKTEVTLTVFELLLPRNAYRICDFSYNNQSFFR